MRVPEHQIAEPAAVRGRVTLPRGLLVAALLTAAIGCVGESVTSDSGSQSDSPEASIVSLTAAPVPGRFSVEIRRPSGPPRVATGLNDAQGNALTVSCSTCHTTRQANHENKTVGDLQDFHGGMAFSHGSVSCLSCHNSGDYDSLKLADGSRVEFTDVMILCGQCHGPQINDYQHGAHGGMNGYWDLTRGPQVKNNCVDCHNPHSPQFPRMQPTFRPKDRFLEQPRTEQ